MLTPNRHIILGNCAFGHPSKWHPRASSKHFSIKTPAAFQLIGDFTQNSVPGEATVVNKRDKFPAQGVSSHGAARRKQNKNTQHVC